MADEVAHGAFIVDLGIVIACAAFVAILFYRLRLPVIMGYLATGVLLGPYLFPNALIGDLNRVKDLSELGVIFLLFSIGIEFDLGKLRRVMGPSFVAVALQTAGMLLFAMLAGPLLGWNGVTNLFFGCILAISSSMVTIRVLRDQKNIDHPHGQLAVGMLIAEDILAVMMLVILTGVSVTSYFEWEGVWLISFLMGVFVVMVYFGGRLLVPPVLDLLNRVGSTELITIFAVGFVMGISVLAHKLHFSVALGAFLSGAVLSSSPLSEKIERSTLPFTDIFGAIFFVTVGMLIDPAMFVRYWLWILLFSVWVIFGKVLTCWLGLFLSGQPAGSGFRAALAKSQIAEFSFIIAGLGHSLGVTGEMLTSITAGVALITILTTPLLSSRSEWIYRFIERKTPESVGLVGQFYRHFLASLRNLLGRSALMVTLKRPFLQNVVYLLLISGIIALSSLTADFLQSDDAGVLLQSGIWLISALAIAPVAVALVRNLDAMIMIVIDYTLRSASIDKLVRGRMRNFINAVVLILVLLVIGGLFLSAAAPYLPGGTALILFAGIVLLSGLFFWRQMNKLRSRLEFMFMESFNRQAELEEEERSRNALEEIRLRYPWPVRLQEAVVGEGTYASGRRIADLALREQTGSTILALGRGRHRIFDPVPETILFPGDKLVLLGDETQQDKAARLLAAKSDADDMQDDSGFEILQVFLKPDSGLVGHTLAGANLRKRFGITVIGIQRGSDKIAPPPPREILCANDILVVVGSPASLEEFGQAV